MTKSFRELVGAQPPTASTQDSVLVIIDAQNEYAEGMLKTANVESTRKAIAQLLDKYRAASAPLVHIVHKTPDGAPLFTPGTSLAKEFSELEPKSGEKVIVKEHPGSFSGTDLETYLKGTQKQKLVLTGYMAHVCVATTAGQAAERGYDVLIAEDAVGDRDIPGVKAEDLKKTVLAQLADFAATVINSSSIN
ncbi:phospholipase C type enzyme [Gnomoniopsis smithogilvyi]|uniref:Phospholipase C type enzyme n=1 Tax=Gnomoniopsis smithogilvyi TaxID=1191159 RepID=A0A9W8YTU0_9PEZI|nr:phospholipase C type enzyme [Gnomoniopsis smithogilvyi]